MKSIKQLKPSKNSRYSQGYINPASCKKLIESVRNQPIIYRSSYEKKFVAWCEMCPTVKTWGSEVIEIPYIWCDGKYHRYYPDYYVELTDGTKLLIEIKPSNQTVPPANENSWAAREWSRNCAKWRAAQEFCKAKGLVFKILTEKTIEKL